MPSLKKFKKSGENMKLMKMLSKYKRDLVILIGIIVIVVLYLIMMEGKWGCC
jgi:hypothetical protein